MSIRSAMIGAVSVLGLAMGSAQADTVMYDNAGFVLGQQTFEQVLDITTPGTLTVTLSNIAWPESLSSLNLLLTTSLAPVGPSMSVGPTMSGATDNFNVAAGPVYALWYGQAQGPLNLGVYGLKIDFTPYIPPPPVPLPTSILLLLSGLGLLAWQRRQRDSGTAEGGMQTA